MLRDWFRKKAQQIDNARSAKKLIRYTQEREANRDSAISAAKTRLFGAIDRGDSEAFAKLLLENPEAPTWKNDAGTSVTEMLARGELDPIKHAIAAQPTEFMSPVGRAVHCQNASALEFFLACGAACEGKDENNSPLISAAKWDDITSIAVLLKYGADMNRVHGDSWDSTPLMAASYLGNCKALEFLLDRGAKVSVSTPSGKDALSVAAQWNGIENPEQRREKVLNIINDHPAKMQAIYNASVYTKKTVTLPRKIKLKP